MINLPADKKAEIEADIMAVYEVQPRIAMVNSDKGITNLHASNDVIIDASLPVVVRDGGSMWNASNELEECVSVIPDRCYATMYKFVLKIVLKMVNMMLQQWVTVPNIGLMATKS